MKKLFGTIFGSIFYLHPEFFFSYLSSYWYLITFNLIKGSICVLIYPSVEQTSTAYTISHYYMRTRPPLIIFLTKITFNSIQNNISGNQFSGNIYAKGILLTKYLTFNWKSVLLSSFRICWTVSFCQSYAEKFQNFRNAFKT